MEPEIIYSQKFYNENKQYIQDNKQAFEENLKQTQHIFYLKYHERKYLEGASLVEYLKDHSRLPVDWEKETIVK